MFYRPFSLCVVSYYKKANDKRNDVMVDQLFSYNDHHAIIPKLRRGSFISKNTAKLGAAFI